MKCPMPIVQLSMAIRRVAVGDEVGIEARDAAFLPDLEAWSRMSGNEIVRVEQRGDVKAAVVRRCT